MSNFLRIIFAGTPDFAAYHLNALLTCSSHKIIGVLTQPDRPAGRKYCLNSSAVKKIAVKYNLLILQPYSINEDSIKQKIKSLNADVMVVVAYSLILPQDILQLPRFGCINVHGSLLPRWRGSAPIQRALCAGDKQTGITIIQMDSGLDSGNILHQVPCDILLNDNSTSLSLKLARIGANALLLTLSKLTTDGVLISYPQNSTLVTYANKLNKQEARIDWYLPALQLELYIRAFHTWPVSFFYKEDKYIRVLQACVSKNHYKDRCIPGTILACKKNGIDIATGSNDLITLKIIQLAGKKSMHVKEILNSYNKLFTPGSILN